MKQVFLVLLFFTARSVLADSIYLQKIFDCKDEDVLSRHTLLVNLWKSAGTKDMDTYITSDLIKTLVAGCTPEAEAEIREAIDGILVKGWRKQKESLIDELDIIARYRPPNEEINLIKKCSSALNEKTDPLKDIDLVALEKKGQKQAEIIKGRCSAVDNLKGFPAASTENKRPRHQDTIGWCYAYTAADLLSYKTGKTISAIDVANAYNNVGTFAMLDRLVGVKESELEGGLIANAASAALDRGLCPEEKLPSIYSAKISTKGDPHKSGSYLASLLPKDVYYYTTEGRENTNIRPYHVADFLHTLDKIKASIVRPDGEEEFFLKKEEYFRVAEEKFHLDTCRTSENFSDAVKYFFPGMSSEELMKILLLASNGEFINDIVTTGCPERFKPEKEIEIDYTSCFWPWNSCASILRKVDEQLEKGSIAGIIYTGTTLTDRYLYEVSSLHASTVVGRRFNEKTKDCEYLIRNSWGDGCENYDPSYDCDQGHIWMPERYLEQAVWSATYVK
jgi:hypothetical protein